MNYHTRQEIVAELISTINFSADSDEYDGDVEAVICDLAVLRYVGDSEAAFAEEYFTGSTIAELTEFVLTMPAGWAIGTADNDHYHCV